MSDYPERGPTSTKGVRDASSHYGDEPMARFNANLPMPLFIQLKIAAARKGTSMTRLIIEILDREFGDEIE